jgi:hypothetical protein
MLRSEVLDRTAIEDAFQAMLGYSGAQTPALADVVAQIPEGTFGEVVRAMHELLARSRSSSTTVVGSKEILVEEFLPTLRDAQVTMLVVIRDPRSVAASTIGPNAAAWTGAPRPLLHTIRLWRKSVAYAVQAGAGAGVTMARFEDFNADPVTTLRRALGELEIESEGHVREPWLDATGNKWKPNTSFPASDGDIRPRFGLTDRQLAYVEALTRPEMLLLGYAPVGDTESLDDALARFRPEDDPGRAHDAFAADFSVDIDQLALERARLDHLHSNEDLEDELCWFVRPGLRDALALAVSRDEAQPA